MPAFVENASSIEVYVLTGVLLVLGLVVLTTGRSLRKAPTNPSVPVTPKRRSAAPLPPPVGYEIVDGDPDAPPVVVVGAPAAWGGSGPIPVEVHGPRDPDPEPPPGPSRLGLPLVLAGALLLVAGAGAAGVAVERVLEKPPTDVEVLLPSTLLGHNESETTPPLALLDRAGRAHDERDGAAYGADLVVLAERVRVADLTKALAKYDDLGAGQAVAKGPRGGVARCYALRQGWTCVLLTSSSAVIVTDTNKRSVVSAAARAREVQLLVVKPVG